MSSIVFIDSRVPDIERLITGLDAGVQVVLLDPTQDGVVQIAAALTGVTELDSIHIISHGSSGTLYLGSTVLTEESLADYETELAHIGDALSDAGDLLLYGCSVGAGATGESFLASLADYTGADVAASTDATGSAALGGDWQLEASTGSIETTAIAPGEFTALLAAPVVTPASTLDTAFSSDGKLTTAIGTGLDQINGVALQADGKIVAAGISFTSIGANDDFALSRYTAGGILDASFSSDGMLAMPVGTTGADRIFSVVLQADGKIVVGGSSLGASYMDSALARYNTDGTLDSTFDGDGKLVTAISTQLDEINGVVVQADGKIVAAGYSDNGTDDDFTLVRYNADGSPDTTFGGGDGIVTTPIGSLGDRASSVVLQSDGKIVVAGSRQVSSTSDFALARYNTDGSLDSTFDVDGKRSDPIGSFDDFINSVVVQADGKIVVAGSSRGALNDDFALARYNTDGSLDSTFDGDGKVTTDLAGAHEFISGMALQVDGKIVVAGRAWNGTNWDFALARYDTSGTLDSTFDGDGKFTLSLNAGDDYATSVLVQWDGAIVAAGVSGGDFAVIRLVGGPGIPDVQAAQHAPFSFTFKSNTFSASGDTLTYTTDALPSWLTFNSATRTFSGTPGSDDAGTVNVTVTATGTTAPPAVDSFAIDVQPNEAPVLALTQFDTTFGGDGKVNTEVGVSGAIWDLALQANGKIVAAGYSNDGSQNDFAVARYNTDGSLDTTFSGDGKVTTAIGTTTDSISSVALQANGKIVVAGYTWGGPVTDFALARYNTNGSLDTMFGTGGKVITAIGTGSDWINGVAIQADGNIVVAGFSDTGSSADFALARYNTNGTLDSTFDSDGKRTDPIGAFNDYITAIALQADGKIVVVGHSQNGTNDDFALARYTTAGALDTTFSGDGKLTTAIGTGDEQINAVAIQADGKIVVAGSSSIAGNDDFALARYNTDGSLDSSFGTGGIVTTPIGTAADGIYALALQADGKIVVAGITTGADLDLAFARYNSDGSLDTTFDDDGRLVTTYGTGNDFALSLVLQADGAIVAGGQGGSGDFDLLRLRAYVPGQIATEDAPFNFALDADTFIDPEGSAITYSATRTNGSALPSWLTFDPSTRTFSGTPLNANVGTVNVKLTAADNWGAMSSTTFNITVANVNDAPVLSNSIPGKSASITTPFNFTVSANTFTDVDAGDVLTYTATQSNGFALPAWLTFSPATRTFSGTPPPEEAGSSYTIKVTATDTVSAFAFGTFGLQVNGSYIPGTSGNNSLSGTIAADYIDGKAGADTMTGLQGDDTYIVDNLGDAVVEQTSQGNDVVQASVPYTLSHDVEDLILTGSSAINGTGNNLNNQITGNSGANRIDGGLGIDTLTGGLGSDTYIVDNVNDQITEASGAGTGNDLVQSRVSYTLPANVERITLIGNANINATGNGLNNTLTGNTGSNILNGGVGNDAMAGGAGNDTYVVNSTADSITEGFNAGIDVVKSSVTWTLGGDVENLILTGSANRNGVGNSLANQLTGNDGDNVLTGGGANDTLNGGVGDDTLRGGAGNDRLDGGSGTDSMEGGTGNDVFFVDTGTDVVVELAGEGTADQVVIGIDFTAEPQVFQLYDNIERVSVVDINAGIAVTGNDLDNLFQGSNAEDSLDGAAGNDTIEGLGGNDTLEGGADADSLEGGDGSDLYYVDDVGDVVVETSNGPGPLADGPAGLDNFTDTVIALIDYSLSGVDYVENLTLSSTATTGTGNELNNAVTGNNLANTLSGLGGADTVNGGAGKDTLTGGTGGDLLKGGTGADRLTGSGGADTFDFSTTLNAVSNVDRIMDFTGGVDEIQLDHTIFTAIATGNLAAGAFYSGTAAHDASDRIIYDSSTSIGKLYYDADGTGTASSAVLFATLAGNPTITYQDFFIVA